MIFHRLRLGMKHIIIGLLYKITLIIFEITFVYSFNDWIPLFFVLSFVVEKKIEEDVFENYNLKNKQIQLNQKCQFVVKKNWRVILYFKKAWLINTKSGGWFSRRIFIKYKLHPKSRFDFHNF